MSKFFEESCGGSKAWSNAQDLSMLTPQSVTLNDCVKISCHLVCSRVRIPSSAFFRFIRKLSGNSIEKNI